MDLPILAVSKLCSNLNYTEFDMVGKCLVESTLFGDVVLAGLILLILFTALIVKYNFPITMILPVGIALTYLLWLMAGADIFMGLLLLGLIVGGGVLIIALLNFLNR
jgi:hypothetical protein